MCRGKSVSQAPELVYVKQQSAGVNGRLKVDCESSWGSFSTSMLEATPACTRCRRRLPQSLSAWKRDIVRSRAGNLEKPAGEGLIVYVSNPEKSHPSLQACLQRQGSKTAFTHKAGQNHNARYNPTQTLQFLPFYPETTDLFQFNRQRSGEGQHF